MSRVCHGHEGCVDQVRGTNVGAVVGFGTETNEEKPLELVPRPTQRPSTSTAIMDDGTSSASPTTTPWQRRHWRRVL